MDVNIRNYSKYVYIK